MWTKKSAKTITKFESIGSYSPEVRTFGTLITSTKVLSLIGRAKRAPHWAVQSRFRVIYVVGMSEYVCRMSVGGINRKEMAYT